MSYDNSYIPTEVKERARDAIGAAAKGEGGGVGSKTLKVRAQPVPGALYKYSTGLTRDAALNALYNGDDIEIIIHDPDYGKHIRVLRVFQYSDPASTDPALWFVGWQWYSESYDAGVQYYAMLDDGTLNKIG